MLAAEIKITKDDVSPAIAAKLAQINPHLVASMIAPPVAQMWKEHLARLPKNKNGYPSTGFWEKAAMSVVGIAVGPDAKISAGHLKATRAKSSADHLGLKQRYYGGTITARNVANLTIPICAEAYGTIVADWGYDNLVLVILGDGRKFLDMWLGGKNQSTYKSTIGKLTKRAETTAARVNKLRARLGSDSGKPDVIIFKAKGSGSTASQASNTAARYNLKFLFVLKQSVEQAGNPNVLPPNLADFALQKVKEATA